MDENTTTIPSIPAISISRPGIKRRVFSIVLLAFFFLIFSQPTGKCQDKGGESLSAQTDSESSSPVEPVKAAVSETRETSVPKPDLKTLEESAGKGKALPSSDQKASATKKKPDKEKKEKKKTVKKAKPTKVSSSTSNLKKKKLSKIEKLFSARKASSQLSSNLVQFGYNLFQNEISTFAPVDDVPVGPDYLIGPGDSFTISLWGKLEKTFSVTVNRDGKIIVPEVGAVEV